MKTATLIIAATLAVTVNQQAPAAELNLTSEYRKALRYSITRENYVCGRIKSAYIRRPEHRGNVLRIRCVPGDNLLYRVILRPDNTALVEPWD